MGTWNLVRHGETVWNRDGRIQGHRHVPLTERGRAQARQLAERLDGQGADVMYSSDLGHALATAQALAASTGVAIRTDANLREFSYGAWEGLTLEEAKAHDPAIFAARITGRNSDVAAPGGETTLDLLERVRRFTDAARRAPLDGRECHHRGARRDAPGGRGVPAGAWRGALLAAAALAWEPLGRDGAGGHVRAGAVERHEPPGGHAVEDHSVSGLTLVLGGVRAGKSAFAQRLASSGKRPRGTGGCSSWRRRRQATPRWPLASRRTGRAVRMDWTTLEAPVDVVGALAPVVDDYDTVLLDCLTLWVSNLLLTMDAGVCRGDADHRGGG